jgi:hypothetical protein
MELYIIRAFTELDTTEAEREYGVVATSVKQAIELASRYPLTGTASRLVLFDSTNLAIDPPARVLGWFHQGIFIAAKDIAPQTCSDK